jgi:hypothetical protein
MVTGHIDYSGATLGMTHNTTNHIGMALFPTPSVLLYFPCVDYVTHKVKCFAGVMFEKVVECFSLAVTGTEVYVRNEYASVGFLWHVLIYCNAREKDITLVLHPYKCPFGIKWFACGLVLDDLGEFLLAKFTLFFSVMADTGLVNFGNQFTLFHVTPPFVIKL